MILFLKPYFEKKPWAGEELNKLFDCPNNTGEAWITSGYNKKSSVISNGIYAGKTLTSLWNEHRELFGDFKYDKEFPVLVKLISAKENLSVQVHPNDDYAIKRHNQLGKFECWYILQETKSDTITLGINVKNALELRDVINRDVVEDYLIEKKINKNDLIVVEPGTVHAINGGTFLLEIQESSDLTYRLYDYNRIPKRELHIEDSLNVIQYNDNKKIYQFSDNDFYENDHFNLCKEVIKGKKIYEKTDFNIIYVLNGKGFINEYEIKKGDSFIITKSSEKIIIKGDLDIMCITPKSKKKERMKMRKTAFITGIVGQDGSYLAELLLSKNYEVHGLIQSKSQLSHCSIKHLVNDSNVMDKTLFFHTGDLIDTSNINRILEKVRPDEIYHLGGQAHVDVSFEMPEYTAQVNALGTLRMLDAIRQSDICTKFFNLSTCQLFDGNTYPQSEETPFNPQSPYAVSKLYAHYMVKNYRENYNLFAVNGIMFNHESPRRVAAFVSKKICDAVKKNKNGEKTVLKLGNLDSKREWGHAKDYAEAMWMMLQTSKPKDYVVGTGQAYSVREFVIKAFELIGINLTFEGKGLNEKGIDQFGNVLVEIDKNLIRPNDAKILVADSTQFKKEMKWEPNYSFDDLLKECILGVK